MREHEIRSVKMGVFDKFLDIMKLNEDDYDDQYDEYDEGGFYDDDEYEEKPRHSFFGKKNNSSKEDSYKDFDVEEEKEFQPAKSKVTQMRTPARHSSSGNMEVCVVKPGSVDHGDSAWRSYRNPESGRHGSGCCPENY